MRRREFIAALGSAVAWPLAARAQQSIPVIGYLSSAALADRSMAAFFQGLSEFGYAEGRNLVIEYRAAEGQYDRLLAMAADLAGRQVAIICAVATSAALAAKMATSTIPVIFNIGGDPVQAGLVAALNRPGSNLTGVARLVVELGPKQMNLLHESTQHVETMGYLINPNNPNARSQTRSVKISAESLKLTLVVVEASRADEIDLAFETLVRRRAGAVVVGADAYLLSQRDRIVKLAAREAIPAIYSFREFTEAGGLMSYGSDLAGAHRQFGIYAGRILRGEKPADLPVIQSTKFEFVVNLKTAKALGLEIPPTLLALADEVIE